jgi:hypothetical protein
MTVTAEHINRIADFVEARIDEQFSGEHVTRHFDKDPVARSMRGALSSNVTNRNWPAPSVWS